MIVTGAQLVELGKKIVSGAEPHIGPSSIDVRLGPELRIGDEGARIELDDEGNPIYHGFANLLLRPGQKISFRRGVFYVAHSIEYISLPPNIGALMFLRSSSGRRGLDHLHAGYLEPGWHGQITFELQPAVDTEFVIGARMAQIVLFTTTNDAVYDGSYNGQVGATLAAKDTGVD